MDDLRAFIKVLSEANPSGDPHGLIDKGYSQHCVDFLNRDEEWSEKVGKPLTMAEWKELREGNDYNAAFSRDILDSEDELTFLFILRDRMVFTAGCADVIIKAISMIIDEQVAKLDAGT